MIKKPIAIIPARIGSKRLKFKNIIQFDNKPLISWTLKAAVESKIFSKIYVSTDSILIKKKIKPYKKKVNFLFRPKKFSGDKTKTSTLLKYLIKKNLLHKKFNDFILLQPTSPLRTKKNIQDMWNIYQKNKLKNLVSVSFKKNDNIVKKKNINLYKNKKKIFKLNNQKIFLNGSVYINNIKEFLKNPDFLLKKNNFFLMDKNSSLDIDYHKDLY